MNIYTVSNAKFYRPQYESLKNKLPLQGANNLTSTNNSKDTVRISAEGLKALNSDANEEVKKFALPGWMTDFSAKVNILNNDDSTKIGYAAWEKDFRDSHANELSEYGKAFSEHFAEAKQEHGILSQADMYQKIIQNPEGSESLRQSLIENLKSDPKVLALMKSLGIKLPE